jgi:hypothetical protein
MYITKEHRETYKEAGQYPIRINKKDKTRTPGNKSPHSHNRPEM